ncbi:ABC transporter permease [Paenibacillus sp. YYML68]|uniref:ABC transporter permease n=1 Tax=Paenibacillus sp. YYML68 TaxID=2909250 RepID=UPI002492EA13|nr:sugar ABC transporter permease [Paenibacillus sp. YYML68]
MWRRSKPYVMLLPAVAVITALFFGGVNEGLLQSLGWLPGAGRPQLSVEAYRSIFSSEAFWHSLLVTLRVALLSTVLSAVLGSAMALGLLLLLLKAPSRRVAIWRSVLQLPLTVPHLAGAYMIYVLLSQSGTLSRVSYMLGLTTELSQFPILVHDPHGIGIIAAYTWKEAPFIMLVLIPVLLRIRDSWYHEARMLGAGSAAFIKEIVWPLITPALGMASFIVFAFTFSAFEVPYVLGVTYPKLLAVLAYERYNGAFLDRPEAMAIGLVLVLVPALLGVLGYGLLVRRRSDARKRWV